MIRRLILAVAAALIVCGPVGMNPARARQSGPAPSDPSLLPDGGPETLPVPGPEPKPRAGEPVFPGDEPGSARPAPAPTPEAKADEVVRVQNPPAGDGSKLPPAKEQPGGVPAADNGPTPDPKWVLPTDRLKTGANKATLTVEVQAPANANVNRPLRYKIFVKNTGEAPAMGVMVYDPLPEGLEFEKSEPPATPVGNILVWQLESLAAGAEKVLSVGVIPRRTGDFDHAPTVTLRTGSRARTMVKHPKLKVEITHEQSGEVLKGRPVSLVVRVTNTGTGPARSVVVHASLSSGLKHEAGSAIEVAFKDYLNRDALGVGESETIPLELDAASGGEQTCRVSAESPDVEDAQEARAEARVTVVEPKLLLELKGSSERYTDTVASYSLSVSNPGTAPARNVVAAAFLPSLSGKLVAPFAPEAKWDSKQRRLYWPVGDLEPGAQKKMTFNVQLGSVGVFQVDSSARAEGCPQVDDTFSTDVKGIADIKCQVITRTKVLDVGEEMIYEIHLKNAGSKDADSLLVHAALTENLRIEDTTGTKEKAGTSAAPGTPSHDAKFPVITLPAGGEHVLTLRVTAMKPGVAKCSVVAQQGDFVVENSTTIKVSEPR